MDPSSPDRLAELAELMNQLLEARGRQRGLAVGSPEYLRLDEEIERLTRLVWRGGDDGGGEPTG